MKNKESKHGAIVPWKNSPVERKVEQGCHLPMSSWDEKKGGRLRPRPHDNGTADLLFFFFAFSKKVVSTRWQVKAM